jgi:hypothetical protein
LQAQLHQAALSCWIIDVSGDAAKDRLTPDCTSTVAGRHNCAMLLPLLLCSWL